MALAVGIGTIVVASHLVPAERIREAVESEIRAATGVNPVIRGDVSVSLFPSSLITFRDVILAGDSQEPGLVAERLIAHLKLWPLLLGRVEAADITLVQPGITLTMLPNGRSNWSAFADKLATTLKPSTPGSRRLMSFSEIRITQGTLTIRDDARGIHETLSNMELSLAWPAISKSFGVTGRFDWRFEPVDASITLADLHAALTGERSGLKIRASGLPLKMAFDGSVSSKPTLRIEGVIAADGASLRDTLHWTGRDLPPGGGFGPFALKAQANVAGGIVSLSRVNAELDGNAVEGVLSLTLDDRQLLQGTLAAEQINLTPYLSIAHNLRSREKEWSRSSIKLDGLSAFDIDVRFSAARLQIANAKLGRTAAAVNLRGSKLSLTVGESAAFGGTFKGQFGLVGGEHGAEVKSEFQFSDVDVEACLNELFGIRRLDGKGNLTLAIEANGSSVLGLARTLSGTVNLVAEKGALTGLNVEQLLRRLERRPLSGGGDFRSGRTPYDKLNVTLKIAQGTASVEEVYLDGTAVRLAIAGSASIPTRDLDLKGTASLINAGTGNSFELPFIVQGPWDDPVMLPDPQILIRRSGAAAPLLDAVRDRKTREAVRSAIEQLARPAGDPTNPAAPATAAPVSAPVQ